MYKHEPGENSATTSVVQVLEESHSSASSQVPICPNLIQCNVFTLRLTMIFPCISFNLQSPKSPSEKTWVKSLRVRMGPQLCERRFRFTPLYNHSYLKLYHVISTINQS